MWEIGLIRLRIGIIGELCECGIVPPGSINRGVKPQLKICGQQTNGACVETFTKKRDMSKVTSESID